MKSTCFTVSEDKFTRVELKQSSSPSDSSHRMRQGRRICRQRVRKIGTAVNCERLFSLVLFVGASIFTPTTIFVYCVDLLLCLFVRVASYDRRQTKNSIHLQFRFRCATEIVKCTRANVKLTFRIQKNSILMSVDSLLEVIRDTLASMAIRKEEEDDEIKLPIKERILLRFRFME